MHVAVERGRLGKLREFRKFGEGLPLFDSPQKASSTCSFRAQTPGIWPTYSVFWKQITPFLPLSVILHPLPTISFDIISHPRLLKSINPPAPRQQHTRHPSTQHQQR